MKLLVYGIPPTHTHTDGVELLRFLETFFVFACQDSAPFQKRCHVPVKRGKIINEFKKIRR